jgi:hypothetical protein
LLPGTSSQSSCWQRKAPPAELQLSTVHGSSSKQLRGSPTQAPSVHTSSDVQGFRSLHCPVSGVCTQPLKMEHESLVHGLWSLQSSGVPGLQNPNWQ